MRRARTTTLLTTGLLAVALLNGCTASVPGIGTIPPPPPQDGALTDRLLSEQDLPTGFTAGEPVVADRPTADRPACTDTLAALGESGPPPPATQARIAFHRAGTQVVHMVHRYPHPADAALAEYADVLSGCARFTLTWTDGMQAVETVALRDTDPWSADVTVDVGALTVRERLVAIPDGDLLAVLSIVGPEFPADAFVEELSGRARELLSR